MKNTKLKLGDIVKQKNLILPLSRRGEISKLDKKYAEITIHENGFSRTLRINKKYLSK